MSIKLRNLFKMLTIVSFFYFSFLKVMNVSLIRLVNNIIILLDCNDIRP